MPEKFDLPFCPLHDYIVETRSEPTGSLKAPRGHSKTTVGCTLLPLFGALEEPGRPFDFYLNVQATDDKALAINRSIKSEIESNQIIRYTYGNQVGSRWTDAEFVTTKGVVFKAVGAGVSIRGIQYNNRRPNWVRADDLYNEEDIHNIEATLKKNAWLKSTLYKTLARGRPTSFHVQGTAINRADILNEMEKWPGCKSRTFSALTKEGKPLWPALYTKAQLEEERVRLGSIIFNRELMNVCQDDSEAIIESAWLQGWEYDPAVRWAKGFTREFPYIATKLCVDPSIGEKLLNDYTGVALIVVTGVPGGNRKDYWIEGLWEEHLSLEGRIALLQRIQEQRKAFTPAPSITQAPIEGIAGFKDFVAQVRARTTLPVNEISVVKDKISNLESKSGHFEGGRIHISRAIPPQLRERLVDQLVQNKPEHDDLRDAVLLGLEDPTIQMKDWV